jgi:carbamoyltransferase
VSLTILGISAFYHDSAACVVQDGVIVAAAQEERFTRKKHDQGFPTHAVEYCLREAGVAVADVDYVGFYDKPILKFERLVETYLAIAPLGWRSFIASMPIWVKEKLFTRELIRKDLGGYEGPMLFAEHHEAHAASAFYPSPFEEAAVLTVDGVGEWATSSYGIGRGNQLDILAEMHFPHSLGMLYSAFTYYTGFRVNSGEYKVMGLAPYGEPKFAKQILDEVIDLKEDGSFKMNMKYFNYLHGLTMTSPELDRLLGGPPRQPESKLGQREMDLAASIQVVTEEVMLRMARHIHKETKLENLCLAGGVALNCVANGRILREGPFKNVWIQPAAGDAGGALGVALLIHHRALEQPRHVNPSDSMQGSYLGPAFSDDEIQQYLDSAGAVYKRLEPCEMIAQTAQHLADERVVGWFQGRMEFGPRALGARSIIGDARSTKMQSIMNLKIKFRESFRPFAPSVLREDVSEYFEMDCDSPYMLLVAPVAKARQRQMSAEESQLFGIDKLNVPRSDIPSVTHVDYSARVQTVHPETNPAYYELLREFKKLTGSPVLVNTSFNVRGEPLVCAPKDAYLCFMRTEMDVLVLNSFVLRKVDQPALTGDVDWQRQFDLD